MSRRVGFVQAEPRPEPRGALLWERAFPSLVSQAGNPISEPKQKRQAMIVRESPGDAPHLDLGKKVSIPQDLMMEELSLKTNRGSRLYQERQKRMQRFVLEHPSGYRGGSGRMGASGSHSASGGAANAWSAANSTEGTGTYHTELHIAPAAKGAPPQVPKKSSRVLQMSKALNPDNLAPGYTGPLKEVPHEKFNFTAIPKAYRSPWQEFLSSEDYQADSKSQLPETPKNLSNLDFRSFNRTPTPFGGPLINDPFPSSGFEMDTAMDTLNTLQLLSSRPSFNRAPRGWVQTLPETEEL
ncbi:myozenin-3 [Alligator mississippiensis]|uniref:Myozenin-3 n=2 Tax=Alligator mississippiensis TaxID=8496 RepID=A0A151M3V3_ALLMI|nr:myozenin-3 [Alligator mississippiensis]